MKKVVTKSGREQLTLARAKVLAGLAVTGARREWPHHAQHLANGPDDVRRPREHHPAFYGCYDWHSSVHGHWTMARLLRIFPRVPRARELREALNENLTAEHLAAELEYFRAPGRRTFERPYGWAWLLALAQEVRAAKGEADARRWARAVRPLEKFIAESFCAWLPKLTHPVRHGVHANTAFALGLALDYARATRNRKLEQVIVTRSREFFGNDKNAPGALEPGGEDFVSPVLCEGDLMRRVLPPKEFAAWWAAFLPELPVNLRTPAVPADRTDPKFVHLDGLNLSRATALYGIASALPAGAARSELEDAAARHAVAGLAHVSSGDYVGEHWLATFALYLVS